jgi:hypothetical protein
MLCLDACFVVLAAGELDKSELKNLMARMGIDVSEKRLTELMGQYDVDQGGKIELHEFLMLLKSQHKEAMSRIKELVEAPIMTLRSDPTKQYLPTTRGTLRITVADGFAKKDQYRIMSACDREYISEVTKDMSGASAAAMISSSLQATKLRLGRWMVVVMRLYISLGCRFVVYTCEAIPLSHIRALSCAYSVLVWFPQTRA